LKETRPLWPPQRGVGLREPNLGKTNPRVSLHYSLAICFAPSLADLIIFLTLTRLVVVIVFEIFSFALFTPPLGDFQQGPGKGDTPKRILPREGTRLRATLLIRGSKAGPSEGFDSRLRSRGPYTHYWSEVRRPAPRKGSTTASGYLGSTPITDQGFEGWPPKGSQPPQTPSEG
jgi:hypothetical protein